MSLFSSIRISLPLTMAESLSSGVEELNLDDWETYCEEKSKKHEIVRRLGSFFHDRTKKMEKLKEYVLASETSKTSTRLYEESRKRVTKYPDEDLYFYIPADDTIGMDMLKNEQCLCALIDTIRWLFWRDEQAELELLLYRSSNFVTLYFAMHEARCLDVLFHLMGIDSDRYCLAGMANGLDWDVWLRSYPLHMEPFLKEASCVGFGISCANKEDYIHFREHLALTHELNVDIKEQNPWHLGKLFTCDDYDE